MTEPLLSASGLHRTVGSGSTELEVLRGVDLEVHPGDYVAITGPSGSGKSTLMNILGLLDVADQGTYRLLGHAIEGLSPAERAGIRAHHIGFVFQAFHLLTHRSVLENVQMAGLYAPNGEITRAEALEALDRVGLADRHDANPRVLSGGERQRVAVARAVAKRPPILLADEPTGNLDAVATTALLTLFDELRDDDVSIVMITHDLDVAGQATRQLQMHNGQLVAPASKLPESSPEISPRADVADVASDVPDSRLGLIGLLSEALAGLGSRPSRALLTGLGTVLGVATLVATAGLSATASSRIVNRFNELSATEVIVEPGAAEESSTLPWDTEQRLRRLNGVQAAGTKAEVSQAASVRTITAVDPTAASPTANLVAGSPGLFAAVRTDLAAGQTFNSAHRQLAARVAVIGPTVADRLNINTLRPDTTIFVDGAPYIVIGVIDDDGVARARDLLTAVIIPDTTARNDFGLTAPGRAHIDTDIGAAQQVAAEAPIVLKPADPNRLRVVNAQPPTRLRDETQQDLNVLLLALGGVSLLVGSIGIANITLIGL